VIREVNEWPKGSGRVVMSVLAVRKEAQRDHTLYACLCLREGQETAQLAQH
jgi:hypothetical protein